MACSTALLHGLSNDCLPNIGGVKKILIANWDEDLFTVEDGIVTSIASGATWYSYYLRKNTASMTQTATIGDGGASNYVTTVISMAFNRMDATKRVEMAALLVNESAVLVQDNNGTWFALGAESPVTCSNGSGVTGTQFTDANQYTLELSDTLTTFPYTVAESAIPTPANA